MPRGRRTRAFDANMSRSRSVLCCWAVERRTAGISPLFWRPPCQDSTVESPDVARAIDTAISIVVALDLPADDATVLQNSNKLALRLLPCDVFARVAPVGHEHARFEVELAQGLAKTESPVAVLEPRVEPRGYERDGFEVTLWTYYEPATPAISPAAYADALERGHRRVGPGSCAT